MRSYYTEDYEKLFCTEEINPCLGKVRLTFPIVKVFQY